MENIQLSDVGAGIQIPPNSVGLLKRLGVYEQVSNRIFLVELGLTFPSCIRLQSLQHGRAPSR